MPKDWRAHAIPSPLEELLGYKVGGGGKAEADVGSFCQSFTEQEIYRDTDLLAAVMQRETCMSMS